MFQSLNLVHATAIALDGHAVLLRGPSGSGKSDLALRLIDEGAELIADDQVALRHEGHERILCICPPRLAGLLEVRGFGPVRVSKRQASAPLALVAGLVSRATMPRVAAQDKTMILGRAVPALSLCAFDASAPARIRLALRLAAAGRWAIAGLAEPDAMSQSGATPAAA